MLVYGNSYLKCGVFGVSHFHKRECQFSIKRKWSFTCFLACLDARHLIRHSTPNFKQTVSNTKMSSEVVEKMVTVKECVQDFPLPSSYEAAMEALSSLITRRNRGDKSFVGGKYGKLERMSEYLKILGLKEQIDGLNIIHVAGTKGKGSTCTFSEAILRECGFQTGLFTSPHLIDVRERFRINGLEISEDKFLQYFWDCWNQLKEKVTEHLPMPPLFQFLTVLAFKIFICEKVDVAIIEVGLGGLKDSTNVIEKPIVCGIASLGMDHTETLGNTLGSIASHKAGIFKPQIPAFTVPQLSEAMDVILERAHELKVPLNVAAPLDKKKLGGLELSLSGDHQFINASLAVSLCKCWLQRTGNWEKLFQNDIWEADLPEAFLRGLSTAQISGRAQIVCDMYSESSKSLNSSKNSCGDLIFYLDGAHSPESMEFCAKWFSSAVRGIKKSSSSIKVDNYEEILGNGHIQHKSERMEESDKLLKQILLFNCMDVRDPQTLLPPLVSSCASSGTRFSKALFVPSMSTYNKVTSGASVIPSDICSRDLSWQFHLQRLWEKVIHGTEAGTLNDRGARMDNATILPPHEFLYEDASHCSPADNYFACSAVMPSLPLTIKWLRDCVKENPSLKVQVLVTGSLHLVGDVLKLLKR